MNPKSLTAEQRHELRQSSRDTLALDYGHCIAFVTLHDSGRVDVRGFAGASIKAGFYYGYKNLEQAGRATDEWAAGIASGLAYKAKRAAERKAFTHTLAVGDVLYSSWGYDQTNIDYYQVTKVISSKMVEIREIAPQSESTGNMTGESVPNVGAFCGPVKRVKVGAGNHVKVGCTTAGPAPCADVGGVRVYSSHRWSAYA